MKGPSTSPSGESLYWYMCMLQWVCLFFFLFWLYLAGQHRCDREIYAPLGFSTSLFFACFVLWFLPLQVLLC